MAERGIRVLTTEVGDRYVLEALRTAGVLGGEQSGTSSTSTGTSAGTDWSPGSCCRAVLEQGRPLADLAAVAAAVSAGQGEREGEKQDIPASVLDEAARLTAELAGRGRVLVGPSGTEPVVRVLAEAETEEEARRLCGTIGSLVERELG